MEPLALTTEQVAETRVRLSEERFRQIAERAGEWIWEVDLEGRYTYSSPAVWHMLGYEPKELIGQKFIWDFFTPEICQPLKERALAAFEKRELFRALPNSNLHKDGTVVHLESSGAPILGSAGECLGYRGTNRNVSERQRADEALQEAYSFNEQIIQSALEGIIVHGTDLRYQVWNPFMEALTGIPAEKVLGKHPLEVFPFLKEAGVMQSLARALAGEIVGPIDFPYHVPSTGKSGWNANTTSPFRNAKGEIIGVISWVNDITERKLAEQRLREAHEFNQKLLAAEPMGVLAYQAESGQCVLATKGFTACTGGTVAQALSQNFRTLKSWRDSGLLAAAEHTLASGQDQHLEAKVLTTFGKDVWLQCHLSTFIGHGEKHLLLLAFDVTQRKQQEALLEQHSAEIRQLNLDLSRALERLEAANSVKNKFMQRMSHEFRTPLNQVVLRCDLMENELSGTFPEFQKDLQQIRQVSMGLAQQMDDLLTLVDLESSRPALARRPIDFVALGEILLGHAQPWAQGNGNRLAVDLTHFSCQLLGDYDRIIQTLLKLLHNACRFTQGGEVRLEATQDREEVIFSVRDTGPGIPPEHLERVFGLFNQGQEGPTRAFGGLGLGLTLAVQLARIMGGRLSVTSVLGEGTVAQLHLPQGKGSL